MAKADPASPLTPADFERADVFLLRYKDKHHRGPLKQRCDCGQCNMLRCYTAILSRMQAAERKVDAWGPIARLALVLEESRDPIAAGYAEMDIRNLARALPADLKPEAKP